MLNINILPPPLRSKGIRFFDHTRSSSTRHNNNNNNKKTTRVVVFVGIFSLLLLLSPLFSLFLRNRLYVNFIICRAVINRLSSLRPKYSNFDWSKKQGESECFERNWTDVKGSDRWREPSSIVRRWKNAKVGTQSVIYRELHVQGRRRCIRSISAILFNVAIKSRKRSTNYYIQIILDNI